MELNARIFGYCERIDAAFWGEPLNAVTNAAFLVAAIVMARRLRDAGLPLATGMVWVLAAIGVGSFLFHTLATRWAAIADVVPILLFILLYIHAANLHFWRLSPWRALALTALFFPYAAATVPLFGLIPGLGGSAGYAPVPLLIALYALLLRRRHPDTARGLAIGAGLLVVSLTARTVDGPLCAAVPFGTHFLWHLLNATMLGWMIEVYRRHMLAARPARR
jgi:hypothetical protein